MVPEYDSVSGSKSFCERILFMVFSKCRPVVPVREFQMVLWVVPILLIKTKWLALCRRSKIRTRNYFSVCFFFWKRKYKCILVEKSTRSCIPLWMVQPFKGKMVDPLWYTIWQVLKWWNIDLPAIPRLGILLRELKIYVHKNSCKWTFTAVLFIVAGKQK